VDDAADVANRGIGDGKPVAERFEGAAGPVMAELGLERIERNGAGCCRRQPEHESCLRVDEAPNQPRGRHPVDARLWPRHPYFVAIVRRVHGRRSRGRHRSSPSREVIQFVQERGELVTSGRFHEVNRRSFLEPLAQSAQALRELPAGTLSGSLPRKPYELAGICLELFEIAAARGAKGRDDLVLGGRVGRPGDEHHRLPPAADDLLLDPLEVFPGFRRGRQEIGGVLQQNRTRALQAAPRLDPCVGPLRGQKKQQAEPITSGCSSCIDHILLT